MRHAAAAASKGQELSIATSRQPDSVAGRIVGGVALGVVGLAALAAAAARNTPDGCLLGDSARANALQTCRAR